PHLPTPWSQKSSPDAGRHGASGCAAAAAWSCGHLGCSAGDELLLRVLQSMRDGMLRRAEQTEKGLEAAARRADAVGFQLRAANCGLELLAQSQFLEHRIEPEECAEVSVEEAAEDLWPEDEPPPESEMDAIRRALDLGQGGLSAAQEEWSALPAVVGSEAWQAVATTAAPSLAESS
ncbi:unnamed protein product, partial [Effrenium voratum]